MSDIDWPFEDPKNVAVLTVPAVMTGDAVITHVYHHEEDGTWEFHSLGHAVDEKDVKVLALEAIVRMDPSIRELAALPCGWEASRGAKGAAWIRKPISPK